MATFNQAGQQVGVQINGDTTGLRADNARLYRWLTQIHASLAEQAETDLEIWTMSRLEDAMAGKAAD
jgi:hypothetical protein